MPEIKRETLMDQTIATCSSACCAQSWCKSFDFKRVEAAALCYLNDKGVADVTPSYSNAFDHYDQTGQFSGALCGSG